MPRYPIIDEIAGTHRKPAWYMQRSRHPPFPQRPGPYWALPKHDNAHRCVLTPRQFVVKAEPEPYSKNTLEPAWPCGMPSSAARLFRQQARGARGCPVRSSHTHTHNASVAPRRHSAALLPFVDMDFFVQTDPLLRRSGGLCRRIAQRNIARHDIVIRMPDNLLDVRGLFSHGNARHAKNPLCRRGKQDIFNTAPH